MKWYALDVRFIPRLKTQMDYQVVDSIWERSIHYVVSEDKKEIAMIDGKHNEAVRIPVKIIDELKDIRDTLGR